MRLALYGGFGEKGRTSLGIEAAGLGLLVDAGIATGAAADRYPAIPPQELAGRAALLVTHAHEDHVGALGWCLANGFRGRVLMTERSRADASSIWREYAEPQHRPLAERAGWEPLPCAGEIAVGELRIRTGRSGHVAGGVWLWFDDGTTTLGYCGDCVPASRVFAMDPLPPCDVLVLDASYGADPVAPADRVAAVLEWVRANPRCILPTPLQGRSLELLSILDGEVAIHASMREALAAQIADDGWLRPGAGAHLGRRLAAAADWTDGEPLPRGALLCHDGMGLGGPARAILGRASGEGVPVLFTGHLPRGSPGHRMVDAGTGRWLRLPTHPTLAENEALLAATGARVVLGHSAEPAVLAELARAVPLLRAGARSGDRFVLRAGRGEPCASC